jgi:hypothetical protein
MSDVKRSFRPGISIVAHHTEVFHRFLLEDRRVYATPSFKSIYEQESKELKVRY